MSILIFGGGDIAQHGIIPIVGGRVPNECNVTSYPQVQAAMRHSYPDVVINCAGISTPTLITESNPAAWAAELTVNLLGSYHVAKAALEHGVDTLIFIASVAGLYGKSNHSGYSASKAGVRSLVQSLAMEGHDAYAVSPGRVDTRMREADYPGEDPRTRLEPRQIGEVVEAILGGDYTPGDNIIIRRIGFETHIKVDRGEPWLTELRVGQPVTF